MSKLKNGVVLRLNALHNHRSIRCLTTACTWTRGILPAYRVNLRSKALLPPSRVLHLPRASKANRWKALMKIHGLQKNVTPKHTLCQHIVGEQSSIVVTENDNEITCRQCIVRLPTKRAADVCHSCGARYVIHALYCHRCGTRR